METYTQLQGWFTELQPYFLDEGFIVKNCNSKSRLTAFPYMSYEEAIAEATGRLGDYTQERTTGMYRTYEEKVAELNAQEEPQPPPAKPEPGLTAPNLSSDTRQGGRFLEPLVAAVGKAAVNDEPFCHTTLERILPTDLYEDLTAALPESRYFQEGRRHPNAAETDKSSCCQQIRLEGKGIENLPDGSREMWQELSEALRSPHLEQAFRRALDSGLAHRFGGRRQSIRVQPTVFLLREAGGYKTTGYKSDTPKVIVAQFHLPTDCSKVYAGPGYYRKHGGAFELATRIPFQPNAGSAFAVTERTFHGTESLPDSSAARDSVVLAYYLRP